MTVRILLSETEIHSDIRGCASARHINPQQCDLPLEEILLRSSNTCLPVTVTHQEWRAEDDHPTSPAFVERSPGPSRHEPLSAGLPEIEPWRCVQLAFASGAAGAVFFNGLKAIMLQWLKNKAARSVTVEVGQFKITIRGTTDAVEALNRLEHLMKTDSSGAHSRRAKKTTPRKTK